MLRRGDGELRGGIPQQRENPRRRREDSRRGGSNPVETGAVPQKREQPREMGENIVPYKHGR